MKILVLGASGMAGHVITKYLIGKGHQVVTAGRNKEHDFYIDAENKNTIDLVVNDYFKYDYVINCIGLLVKDSNTNPSKAITINSWFPHYIESLLVDSKTRIIHLSTDCVFNGIKGSYVETDIPDETNFYGRSKALGEINNQKDITFRMSIIGTELKSNGTGLLHWVLNNKDDVLPGWENAWWNGITTLQLAKSIEKYMNNPCITGVYHLVSDDINPINKYELLKLINHVYDLGKAIEKTSAIKGVNKVLIDTRREINFEIPDYYTMLSELKEFVQEQK